MTNPLPVGRAVPGIDPGDALEVLPHGEPRGDWLAVRRRGIGGSDASAVLGFNTHRSPLEVWDDKTGRGLFTPDNTPMHWGRLLEPVIRDDFATERDLDIVVPGVLRSQRWPWMQASLDGLCSDGALLEIKATDYWGRQLWDDGQTPDHAEVQVQHNCAVTGLPGGWVRCFAGITCDAITRWVPRDDELIADLVEIEREFWEDNVLAGVEPRAGGSEAVSDFLARRYPNPQIGAEAKAEPADVVFIRTGYGQRKAAESYGKEKAAENRARQLLGDATELVDANGELVATWRKTGKFDAASFEKAHPDIAAEYRVKVDALDAKAIERDHPEKYTTHRGRVLLVKS